MHGLVLVQLRNFAEARFGPNAWRHMHERAGIVPAVYLPIATYADDLTVALIKAAASIGSLSVEQVLDSFGMHLAPALMRYPGVEIPPYWRTLDLIENTETLIHKTVRRVDPNARPPHLGVTRSSPTEVTIRYDSPLKLCALAKGIVRGIAAHYVERITLHEESCMLLAAPRCEIVVRLRGTTTKIRAVKV